MEIGRLYNNAFDLYNMLLERGVAKECARSILPLGTPTRLYMAGTIRSWIHYVQIRADKDTQFEHRLIAEAVKEILVTELPNVYEAVFC